MNNRPAVANALRLHLPDTIAQMVAGRELSAGHAPPCWPSPPRRSSWTPPAAAVDKSLSVRDLERMAKASRPRKEKGKPGPVFPPALL